MSQQPWHSAASYAGGGGGLCKQAGKSSAHHSDVVEIVDQEDGAQLLGLEGARQLHEQVHAGIPHTVQVVIQLPILHHVTPGTPSAAAKCLHQFLCRHIQPTAMHRIVNSTGIL